ncbi:hypothetical protein B0H16DRAFT_1642892 [Mycena metata]|uniref:Uncharacterized protein n=1 Tax=Mycena metata TaxID=1033252 RepID=A0AAD7GL96_9AGAR|nr:hypothetical protein B0H16DRAFT_1642892 [Mycena metata]
MSNYVVNSGTFNSCYSAMVAEVTTACTELLIYGIYIVLFSFAMSFLALRQTGGKKVLLVYTVAMALLGTTQLIISITEAVLAVRTMQIAVQGGNTSAQLRPENTARTLEFAQTAIFWVNNLVSDSLLLYPSCFIIWGSRWRPVILPAILIVATLAVGCSWYTVEAASHESALVRRAPFILAVVTNLVLVTFTAGRIWWIRHDALRVFNGGPILNRYDTVIAMILESGALYFIVAVLLVTTTEAAIVNQAILGIAIHFINIAPNLIVVRVGLGYNIQDSIKGRPVISTRQPLTRIRFRTPPSQPSSLEVIDINPSKGNTLANTMV